jgi:hypothetical protein
MEAVEKTRRDWQTNLWNGKAVIFIYTTFIFASIKAYHVPSAYFAEAVLSENHVIFLLPDISWKSIEIFTFDLPFHTFRMKMNFREAN